MTKEDPDASISAWLKEKGYTEAQTEKILAKLAEHDHQTLTDAIYDSIGVKGVTLDEMIGDLLRD